MLLFRYHHPAWPLPLCEREAGRLVGALVGLSLHAGAAVQPRRVPPLDLLIDLATPETPDGVRARDRCAAMGAGGAFRDVGRVPAGWRPMPGALALLRPSASPAAAPG